ncbi:MAG: YihY/virulence factor BrkB family protein [Prevotella sp.]|nr:YihY/virulence factor BrkB family protein [Prevotella sp.]
MKHWISRAIRQLILAIRFFTAKRVLVQASALTYSTLLALVPILAVVFAIARGFGFNRYIEIWFRNAMSSQPQVAEIIIGFVNSYLIHTKSGIFLGVGLVFMLYTVLMLVSNIEQTFNQIWQVKKPRSIFRTVTDYLSIFFLFPIIIVVATGLSIFVTTLTTQMSAEYMLLGPAVRFLIDLAPFALMSVLFIALYVFMPNTHVNLRSAIIPGILAGIAMKWLQLFYIHSQIWVTGYNAIYGSFAALPLFMLWIQISWTICLFGAVLTYTNQTLEDYDYTNRTSDISHRYRMMLCGMLMGQICRQFAKGGKPYTAIQLREATGIPIRVVNDLIFKLIEARLLIEINSDEKGEASRYMPAESLDNLSLGLMVDRLEAQGKWQPDFDMKMLEKSAWKQTISLRTANLKSMNTIRLEDL